MSYTFAPNRFDVLGFDLTTDDGVEEIDEHGLGCAVLRYNSSVTCFYSILTLSGGFDLVGS